MLVSLNYPINHKPQLNQLLMLNRHQLLLFSINQIVLLVSIHPVLTWPPFRHEIFLDSSHPHNDMMILSLPSPCCFFCITWRTLHSFLCITFMFVHVLTFSPGVELLENKNILFFIVLPPCSLHVNSCLNWIWEWDIDDRMNSLTFFT